MDPIEQKPTRLYPNADRKLGDADTNTNKTPGNTNEERPLVSFSSFVMPKSESEMKGGTQSNGAQTSGIQTDNTGNTNTDITPRTSSVHTFKDDLAREASAGGFSIGKVIMANNKRSHESGNGTLDIPEKNNHWGVKILVFVICILIIGGFAYIGFRSAKTPEEINIQRNPTQITASGILYTEESVVINVKDKSASEIVSGILKDVASVKVPTGKIKSVILSYQNGTSSRNITASEFLNLIAPSVPDILVRNLKPEYVFGYYSYDSNEPFIILKSANYDSTFAGMLDWEISMYADIGDLIFRPESLSTNASTVATTSTTSKAVLVKNTQPVQSEYDTSFVDKVISNNDTRVLYRPSGNIAFFYTFFNKDTIIIATSDHTLKEVIDRLTTGKITR